MIIELRYLRSKSRTASRGLKEEVSCGPRANVRNACASRRGAPVQLPTGRAPDRGNARQSFTEYEHPNRHFPTTVCARKRPVQSDREEHYERLRGIIPKMSLGALRSPGSKGNAPRKSVSHQSQYEEWHSSMSNISCPTSPSPPRRGGEGRVRGTALARNLRFECQIIGRGRGYPRLF